MKKKAKKFDCLEMKERIQAEMYKITSGMTLEEEAAYYNKSAESGPFAEWLKLMDNSKNGGTETPVP